MVSVILLVLTVILLVIGGVCGFRRGVLKEGVRIILWIIMFACSCLLIPQVVDRLPLVIAERFELTAADVEQLASLLLNKVDFLKKETYLMLPLAGFIRTLFVPAVTIAFFWVSGFASWVLYLVVSLFLRKKTEQQKVGGRLAGLVLGLVLALFCGTVTIYPVAAAGDAVREGDSNQTLCKEFDIVKTVAKSYEGSYVKMIYQYTGTEAVGASLHSAVNAMVITEDAHNIWNELPSLVRLGSEGWQTYTVITGKTEEQESLREHTHQLLDAYFSLKFFSEENKLSLLRCLKSKVETSVENNMVTTLLCWLEINNKEQFFNDAVTYAYLYDTLAEEGILDVLLTGTDALEITEQNVITVLDIFYGLSNAETVVPVFVNLIYSTVASDTEKELIQTENLVLNDKTKQDILEVVSFVYKMQDVYANAETMTMDEKIKVLEDIKALEDNSVINQELVKELLSGFVLLP